MTGPTDAPDAPDSVLEVLRPATMDEIIGQQSAKDALTTFIDAARMQDRALDHVLLIGQPGLGKTTFAGAVARALGKPVIIQGGPGLNVGRLDAILALELAPTDEDREDFGDLVEAKIGAVLLVDEVHAIPKNVYESLIVLMEDFTTIDGLGRTRQVPPFTLVGATTDPGKLPEPLRERFGITVTLDYYGVEELMDIVERSYRVLTGLECHDEQRPAITMIAQRSRGTPRTANRLLKRCLDVCAAHALPLNVASVQQTMAILGIDKWGLTSVDRKIIEAMALAKRPMSLGAIASKVGEIESNIAHVYEPWLVRAGLVERSMRGRVLSHKGTMTAIAVELGKVEW